ncbi:WhiB family transcriptional regulator [Sphaerisporangium viridialbum]|uniref:WhiB family transcriptional regulator n=1 Tax=Sphaerisporangium viridialbum TaxID=46189 RepID=UPI003C74D6A3
MSSHIVTPRPRAVTSAERLRHLDTLILTGRALCRTAADPDDWYPLADDDETMDAARAKCDGCPFTGMTGACVERASLMPYDSSGIIGGTTPKERRQFNIGAEFPRLNEVAA